MGDLPDRRGLNEVEAILARRLVEEGEGSDILDGLEPGAAAALGEVLESVDDVEATERGDIVDAWRARDDELREEARGEISARGPWAAVARSYRDDEEPIDWVPSEKMRRALAGAVAEPRRDSPVDDARLVRASDHFDAIVRMEPERFRAFVADLGADQVAALVRDRNRRRIARVSRKLSESRRELFVDALQRERDLDPVEETRLREVFITLSRHYEDFDERVEQLGIYSVACACCRRFRGRLLRLRRGLSEGLGERLMHYYRLSHESSRRGVARRMRASIEEFLQWHSERAGGDDDGGDDD